MKRQMHLIRKDMRYAVNHNSQGKGKGVTVYYNKEKYNHKQNIREENIQVSKYSGTSLDVLVGI